MKYFFTIFFFISFLRLSAQDSLGLNFKTIGIEYFGELGLHPGIKIDVGIPIWSNDKLLGKRNQIFYQNIIIRPNIGYYHLPKYTNNYFIGLDFSLQFLSQKIDAPKYFFFESYFGVRYLRYNYIGRIYETNTSGGFTEKKSGGGNSMLVASGFMIGGHLPIKNMNWILGAEYFIELSDDKLVIHHPTLRLGIRLGI